MRVGLVDYIVDIAERPLAGCNSLYGSANTDHHILALNRDLLNSTCYFT